MKCGLHHLVQTLGTVAVGLVMVGSAGMTFATSRAAAATEYKVTFAALVCPRYADVFANRARNNIQESLEDLGPNSQYTNAGDVVTPEAESKPPQDVCDPLVGWKFTLGPSYQTQAVNGAWGSLTKVTNPFDTAITTEASVPELDGHGVQVGSRTVAGATTVTLTEAQATLAARADLWVQGGTPSDPVLAQEYGGVATPRYGFAALRCSNDAWNGDNVEYIDFPTGDTHVYCYAIYVEPPPTSGTIVVRKQVTGSGSDPNSAFLFNSASLYEPHAPDCVGSLGPTCDLSYDPNGFTLKHNGSVTFFRGEGQWTIVEGNVLGYDRTAINCTSADGSSTFTTDTGSGVTQVQLAAGDVATCTYVNNFSPPAGLSIFKLTTGGVGHFSFKATRENGGSHEVSATTKEPGVPAEAGSGPVAVTAGTYRIEETPPQSDDGHWQLTRVDCDGREVNVPVSVKLTSGEVMACTFENHFTPSGSITLHKVTHGATGTAGFTVTETTNPQNDFVLHATTKHEGIAATAVATTGNRAPTGIDLGSYTITEYQPAKPTDGTWLINSVVCDGTEIPFENGVAHVTLTRERPHQNCTFTDRFIKHYYPPVIPGDPANLRITKTVSPRVVQRGQHITYRLKVTNLGPDTAQNVVVNDRPGISPYVVRIHNPTGGKCTVDRAISCYLGTIKPHRSVTLTIVLSTDAWHGKVWNFAVVGSSTPDPNLRNNSARARVRVKPTPVSLGYLRG